MKNNVGIEQNTAAVYEKGSKPWFMAFRKKRSLLLLLTPISFFILWLAQNNSKIAEFVFARGIYKWVSQGISLVTGLFSFSIMELQIITLPFLVVGMVLWFIWKLIRSVRKGQRDTGYLFTTGLLNAACIISSLIFFYIILCGINYHRYPFAVYSGLEVKESTVEELYNLTAQLAKEASAIREELQLQGKEDENGVIRINNSDWEEVARIAEESFAKAAQTYPVLGGNYNSLKTIHFSEFMSRMEITGIYWPFTMEANVNIEAPEYSIPATMCHELAHLRGFMREDEANFIAYLICKQSDNLAFQYSGTMLALSYAGNQLYKQDQELYRVIQNTYHTGMQADLREEYYYWVQFRDTTISAVSSTMNDNYLKANKQSDGVKSYGRMVDLLLAEYRYNQGEE